MFISESIESGIL